MTELFDLTFIAAIAAAVAAPLAALGWGGRGLKWIWSSNWLLLVVNLVLSWGLDDPADSVLEGQTAAFGMMFSVVVFLVAMMVTALTWATIRFAFPPMREGEGTKR